MTTIAFDGRYIAVDGRISQDNRICDDSCEKFIVRDSWVIFLAGKLAIQKEFVDCFIRELPFKKKGSIVAIAFCKTDNKVYDIVYDEQFDICELYHKDAIGSGKAFAIAAMDLGFSAAESVKFASTRDMHTGGIIRCFDTKTQKFVKVKQ